MAASPVIHVVAGTLADAEGRILIAQRPRGRHMAGRWEFPGGKLGYGEESQAGLRRELSEEIGIVVREAQPLIRLCHDYPDRRVMLDVWQVTAFEGEPRPLDAQALAWVRPDELPGHDLLEADRAIVTALRLPRVASLVNGAAEIEALREGAPRAILWALPEGDEIDFDPKVVRTAREAGHRVFMFGDDIDAVRAAAMAGADGAVLNWRGQSLHVDRSGAFLIGVLCEDVDGALEAIAEGAHFLLLAPEDGPLADRDLGTLCENAGLPVFAGWYADEESLERLQRAGAHGCALRDQLR